MSVGALASVCTANSKLTLRLTTLRLQVLRNSRVSSLKFHRLSIHRRRDITEESVEHCCGRSISARLVLLEQDDTM